MTISRANNRSMFYHGLGTDSNYVEECIDPASPIRYSEFRLFGASVSAVQGTAITVSEWLSEPLRNFGNHIWATADGAVSALYEYDVALRRVLPPEK